MNNSFICRTECGNCKYYDFDKNDDEICTLTNEVINVSICNKYESIFEEKSNDE